MRWIFLLLPWVELFTLIQLGRNIGALGALAYVFLTMVLGVAIMRLQGAEVIRRMQAMQQDGLVVDRLMADELATGLAGLLLVVPGMITDIMAVLVMIGPLRRRIFRGPGPRAPQQEPSHRSPETLEGEFQRIDPD